MIIKPRTLLALSILTAFNVHSAGFQVAEHSASGLGRCFLWLMFLLFIVRYPMLTTPQP